MTTLLLLLLGAGTLAAFWATLKEDWQLATLLWNAVAVGLWLLQVAEAAA